VHQGDFWYNYSSVQFEKKTIMYIVLSEPSESTSANSTDQRNRAALPVALVAALTLTKLEACAGNHLTLSSVCFRRPALLGGSEKVTAFILGWFCQRSKTGECYSLDISCVWVFLIYCCCGSANRAFCCI